MRIIKNILLFVLVLPFFPVLSGCRHSVRIPTSGVWISEDNSIQVDFGSPEASYLVSGGEKIPCYLENDRDSSCVMLLSTVGIKDVCQQGECLFVADSLRFNAQKWEVRDRITKRTVIFQLRQSGQTGDSSLIGNTGDG